jgi:hypothetical protein
VDNFLALRMAETELWLSGTALAKRLNIPTRELFSLLASHGWIQRQGEHWRLTGKGEFEGGRYQNSERYGAYIAWPERIVQHRLFNASSQEHSLLTSAMLGARVGLSARQVNLLLLELGWVRKGLKGWELSPQGKALGGLQEEYPDSGVPYVRWPASLPSHPVLLRTLRVLQACAKLGAAGEASEGELFEDPGPDIRTRLDGVPAFRAVDGHVLPSRAQLLLCNWFYMSGIVHATGRRLPVEGEYRCDFYLPSQHLYVEYWGDEAAPGLLSAKLEKRAVYERHGLALLELDAEDLPKLDEVLPRKLLRYGLAVY